MRFGAYAGRLWSTSAQTWGSTDERRERGEASERGAAGLARGRPASLSRRSRWRSMRLTRRGCPAGSPRESDRQGMSRPVSPSNASSPTDASAGDQASDRVRGNAIASVRRYGARSAAEARAAIHGGVDECDCETVPACSPSRRCRDRFRAIGIVACSVGKQATEPALHRHSWRPLPIGRSFAFRALEGSREGSRDNRRRRMQVPDRECCNSTSAALFCCLGRLLLTGQRRSRPA